MLVVDDERPALDELAYLLGSDDRVGAVPHVRLGDRGAAGAAATTRSTRSSSTSPMPGLDRARAGRGAVAGSRRRRRSCSSPRTTEHAVDAFDLRRRRLRAQAGARGAAARGGPPRRASGRPAAAPPERGHHPGRARRGHPVRAPLRRRATSRRRATTPGCTPADGQPPGPAPADDARGAVGATPGFVRIHRSLLVALRPRRRGAHRGRPLHGRWSAARELPGQPPAHPRAARPAAPHRQGAT